MGNFSGLHKIDLHMHSTVSDGTDSPEELLEKVKAAGIDLFSLTDHDAIAGADIVKQKRGPGDPLFISGVEFSCRDEFGKYHILGLGYDSAAPAINDLVNRGHSSRIIKMKRRLEALENQFGFGFSEEDTSRLFANKNPGKPHLANLMVEYGYVPDKEHAFSDYLNRLKIANIYFRPEEAISAVLQSGGIPVLAHPSYGSGDELILGTDMENRLKRLLSYGLQGVEGYYSTFTPQMHAEILELAEKYDLYVTAGSDYHGKNKMIALSDHNLTDLSEAPRGLHRFLEDVNYR